MSSNVQSEELDPAIKPQRLECVRHLSFKIKQESIGFGGISSTRELHAEEAQRSR